jgi:hypothetical protein
MNPVAAEAEASHDPCTWNRDDERDSMRCFLSISSSRVAGNGSRVYDASTQHPFLFLGGCGRTCVPSPAALQHLRIGREGGGERSAATMAHRPASVPACCFRSGTRAEEQSIQTVGVESAPKNMKCPWAFLAGGPLKI